MEQGSRIFDQTHLFYLCILAVVGLLLHWSIFWLSVRMGKGDVNKTLHVPNFLKTATVAGAIAATTVLSLAQILEGQVAAAILSGIVGYVLGTSTQVIRGPNPPDNE